MRTIIIIPYRDRQENLEYFLNHSVPLLKKYISNIKIVVVEQVPGKLFNRGLMLNIGFQEVEGENYFTHDVDINPLEHTIKDFYNKHINENDIMGIYTSQCNTLGGIIKFKKSTFININGFPNNFWGWGCEDKDLQNRAEFKKVNITKNILNNNPNKENYFTIFDDGGREMEISHSNFVYAQWKNLSDSDKEIYLENNGLTTLNYKKIKQETLMEDVIKITVEV